MKGTVLVTGGARTVRPKVFKKAPPDPARKGKVLLEALKLIAPQTKLVETIRDPGAIDIAAHDILVSGGRGLKKEENFQWKKKKK